jgi:hypothetical protein
MKYTLMLFLVGAVIFFGMILFQEAGRRIGALRLAQGRKTSGTGAMEGAVFALLGLLIAFTFSGAASRFDERRARIVEEANDIGTAYLRIDLLEQEDQPALRELFRAYLDSRIETYSNITDIDAAMATLAKSAKLQGDIWTRAVAACRRQGNPAATTLLLSALNSMIDIVTTRTMSTKMHPPEIIFGLLFGLSLGCALLAGYNMADAKESNRAHMIGFAAIMAVTFYVILDIEYPHLGLIRVDAFNEVLIALRASMN